MEGGGGMGAADTDTECEGGSPPATQRAAIRALGSAVPCPAPDMSSGEEDGPEEQEERRTETKMNIFKGGIAASGIAKKIVTMTEETKGGRIGQLFR
jgi:hypothetical protein